MRQICEAYARSPLDLWQIAQLASKEGWLTVRGQPLQERNLRTLLCNEALVGNFVWGISGQNAKQRIVTSPPTRMNGSVPRIVDDETWALVQQRLRLKRGHLGRLPLPNAKLRRLRADAPRPSGMASLAEHSGGLRLRGWRRRQQNDEFGSALAACITNAGGKATFDPGRPSLYISRQRLRFKLMWCEEETWRVPRLRSSVRHSPVLLVQMEAEYRPVGFYLLPPGTVPLSECALSQVPAIEKYRCDGPSKRPPKAHGTRRGSPTRPFDQSKSKVRQVAAEAAAFSPSRSSGRCADAAAQGELIRQS